MHQFCKFIFGMKLYMFRDSSSVHHKEFFTVHTPIGICHTGLLTACEQYPARKLYDIHHCCVYSEKLLMMDRGTVPKHVEFYSKNKFEKLVNLADFILL